MKSLGLFAFVACLASSTGAGAQPQIIINFGPPQSAAPAPQQAPPQSPAAPQPQSAAVPSGPAQPGATSTPPTMPPYRYIGRPMVQPRMALVVCEGQFAGRCPPRMAFSGCGAVDQWANAQCRSQRLRYIGKVQRQGRPGDQCGYAIWTVACGL